MNRQRLIMLNTFVTWTAILLGTHALTKSRADSNSDPLTVHATTGTFKGNLNDTYPNVRQFKYVPYAKVSKLARHIYSSPLEGPENERREESHQPSDNM
jgi:hypothetical protein